MGPESTAEVIVMGSCVGWVLLVGIGIWLDVREQASGVYRWWIG